MSRKLVAYFSASGVTRDYARSIAALANADLYEIRPEVAYTQADLNWQDKNSRSSVEMSDKTIRPAIADRDAKIEDYDTVLLGFPIWWYVAPTIVNTFLETYDFSGKTVIVFATSGSSGLGNTVAELKASAPNAAFVEGKVVSKLSAAELEAWAKGL